VQIAALSTYRPSWADGRGRRVLGADEDVATLAVAAGRLMGERLAAVRRVVLVTRRPDALLGTAPEVVLEGLGLDPATPLVEQIGGAPATLDALLGASEGTLVLAVDPGAPAAAAAALVGPGGLGLDGRATVRHSVPVRTLPLPGAADLTYDDPRLLRERGWKRVVAQLAGKPGTDVPVAIAGIPPADAAKTRRGALTVPETEAAAPLLLLAGLVAGDHGAVPVARLVTVENGHGVAADVTVGAGIPLAVVERTAHEAPRSWDPAVPAELPASPAAYERAFEAKVGLKAGACGCGVLNYPPRAQCQACGVLAPQPLEPLPRAATIYSVVTVRAAVPGKTVPYSLAVVDVDGTGVRVLAHVTDDPPGAAPIGAAGELVLRRIAIRAGIPDYGYAFQPEEQHA
jgi:uncharacterized OB-fold protein